MRNAKITNLFESQDRHFWQIGTEVETEVVGTETTEKTGSVTSKEEGGVIREGREKK